VDRIGEMHQNLFGKPEGKRPLKDLSVNERIILKRILNKKPKVVCSGFV
jgi:hypothetical protein